MKTSDFDRFKNAMLGAWLAITNGKEDPTKNLLDVFWSVFREVSIERFESAINAHMLDSKRGVFTPKPADIQHQLSANDGRPGADEAWGIALSALTESSTIVWTPEIRSAWAAAEPVVVDAKDKIGGRKAFMETYQRLIETARRNAEPIKWEVSLGDDKYERETAIQQARKLNRIGNKEALAMIEMVRPLALPSPDDGGIDVLTRIESVRDSLAMKRAETQAVKEAERLSAVDQKKAALESLLKAQELIPKALV